MKGGLIKPQNRLFYFKRRANSQVVLESNNVPSLFFPQALFAGGKRVTPLNALYWCWCSCCSYCQSSQVAAAAVVAAVVNRVAIGPDTLYDQ